MNGFTDSETKFYISAIRGNLIDAMVALVEGVDLLGEFFEKSVSSFLLCAMVGLLDLTMCYHLRQVYQMRIGFKVSHELSSKVTKSDP